MNIKATPGSILKYGFTTFFKEWWQFLLMVFVLTLPSFFLVYTSSLATAMPVINTCLAVLAVLFSFALFILIAKVSQDRIFSDRHSTFHGLMRFLGKNYISLVLTVILTILLGIGLFVVALIPIAVVALLFYGIYTLVMASNVAAVVVTGFGSVIVFLLLFIAFVLVFTHLMFTPYVVLFNGKRYMAAIRKSLQLVKSRFWNVLGNTIVLLLVGFAIAVVVGLVFLPLLIAFKESVALTTIMGFVQQYISIPVSIAFISMFFTVDYAVSNELLTNGSSHVLKVMARSIRCNSIGYRKPSRSSSKAKSQKSDSSSRRRKSASKQTTIHKSSSKAGKDTKHSTSHSSKSGSNTTSAKKHSDSTKKYGKGSGKKRR